MKANHSFLIILHRKWSVLHWLEHKHNIGYERAHCKMGKPSKNPINPGWRRNGGKNYSKSKRSRRRFGWWCKKQSFRFGLKLYFLDISKEALFSFFYKVLNSEFVIIISRDVVSVCPMCAIAFMVFRSHWDKKFLPDSSMPNDAPD